MGLSRRAQRNVVERGRTESPTAPVSAAPVSLTCIHSSWIHSTRFLRAESKRGAMTTCAVCDSAVSGVSHYVCSYCGVVTCPQHHVPEAHDCTEQTAASAPGMTQKHIDLGVERTRRTPPQDPVPSNTEASAAGDRPMPEGYPARRRTEPVTDRDDSPAGKRHRDWMPDSKSPDVNPDGSLATQSRHSQDTPDDRDLDIRKVAVILALLGVFAVIYLI